MDTDDIVTDDMNDEVFPSFMSYEDREFESINELGDLLIKGLPITEVEVMGTFEDDHELCVNFFLTVDGKRFGTSLWWLAPDGIRTIYQAEVSKKARKDLRDWLLTYTTR